MLDFKDSLSGAPLWNEPPSEESVWSEGGLLRDEELFQSNELRPNLYACKESCRPLSNEPMHKLEEFRLSCGPTFRVVEVFEVLDPNVVVARVSRKTEAKSKDFERKVSCPTDTVVGTHEVRYEFIPIVAPEKWVSVSDAASRKKALECSSVYAQAMVTALLSVPVSQWWVPHFPVLYDCFQCMAPTYRMPSHKQIANVEVPAQVLVVENMTTLLLEYLLWCKAIDANLVLSLCCQLCFGLAYAQNVLGFLHSNLTTKHIGLQEMRNKDKRNYFLFYSWNKTLLRVPAHGWLVKILPTRTSSVVVNNVRLGPISPKNKSLGKKIFSLDLKTFVQSLTSPLFWNKLARHPKSSREVVDKLSSVLNAMDRVSLPTDMSKHFDLYVVSESEVPSDADVFHLDDFIE